MLSDWIKKLLLFLHGTYFKHTDIERFKVKRFKKRYSMIILREIVIIPNKRDCIQQVVTQLKKDIL